MGSCWSTIWGDEIWLKVAHVIVIWCVFSAVNIYPGFKGTKAQRRGRCTSWVCAGVGFWCLALFHCVLFPPALCSLALRIKCPFSLSLVTEFHADAPISAPVFFPQTFPITLRLQSVRCTWLPVLCFPIGFHFSLCNNRGSDSSVLKCLQGTFLIEYKEKKAA